MREAQVHTVAMSSPSDTLGLERLFASQVVDPAHVVALMAQTEGDGYARGYAALSLQMLFARLLSITVDEAARRIPMLMIGGTAGLMSPHVTLFVKQPTRSDGRPGVPRLAIGVASTPPLRPEDYGTTRQVALVTSAVLRAIEESGMGSPDDVACVELKCPQMTEERMADALARGAALAHASPAVSSSRSRGASALGAAVALGEVDAARVTDDVIGREPDIFTRRASASSGSEQDAVRVVVIGNADGAPGDYLAGQGVMQHQLDLAGARHAFTAAGLRLDAGMVHPEDRPKVAAVFVNAGADALPHHNGRRHTMLSDILSHASGHVAKAVAHATVAGIVQDTLFLCSAGFEHQGRPGENLLCVIANHGSEGRP